MFRNLFYFCVIIWQIEHSVYGGLSKSSLTFVIDNTASMGEEIQQVKVKTKVIFDAIVGSNASKIQDYILITFNDPDAVVGAVTKDPSEFKRAVDNINLYAGGDCPEYAMTGIELALEKSKPNSFLYVYTDASAKDYTLFDRVKSLSLKKSTQVSFLLTGECSGGNSLVYDDLALATSGQVFHIQKNDVDKIIDYIIDSVKHVKTTLGQMYNTMGSEKKMQFIVDSKVWDVIVSVSAANPQFHVIGPDGEVVTPIQHKSIHTHGTKIEQLQVKPGVYTVVLDTNTPASVVVTGSTLVTFQHGFSTFEPAYLNETSTKPIPDENSYLSIKLDNFNKDVLLNIVELQDLNDNTIATIPLKLINENDQFYVTKPFLPPQKGFKLRVTGYTKEGEKIIRLGTTTIEPQNAKLEKEIKYITPTVIIVDGHTINAEYDEPLNIKCKVNAYPKPDVIWHDSMGTVWPSKVIPVDLPYDYISILNVDKVNKNLTYTCQAINTHGVNNASITVETKRKYFVNILERPIDTTIQYGNSFNFQIIAESYPPATFSWFKGSSPIILDDSHNLSTEKFTSILTLKNANLTNMGKYYVEVYNGYQRVAIYFDVFIHAELPKIDKSIHGLRFKVGSAAVIKCNVIRGYPAPKISWSYKHDDSSKAIKLDKVKDTIVFNSVTKSNTGIYVCTAFNELGRDSHDIDVFIEYPPTIKYSEDEIVNAVAERRVKLVCLVDGAPSPSIKWFKNNVEIKSTSKHHIYRSNILRLKAKLAIHGAIYTCEATNALGKARKNFQMNIRSPARIEPPELTKLSVDIGNPLTLTCKVYGIPKPEVRWTFYSFSSAKPKAIRADEKNTININRTKFEDEGIYICMANNSLKPEYLSYEVHITAKPSIVNTLVDKTLKGIVGDLVLRIPCKAVGSPRPTITWTVNDKNIAVGSDWYDVDDEGTLIIKNLDISSEGTYKCKAENEHGFATEIFKVDIKEYPDPDRSVTNILLEEGASADLGCDLPHDKKDLVRWFKDGEMIAIGKFHLLNAKLSDSGIYTCRVSNFMHSDSSHKKISVGRKPQFSNEEETDIEYNEGSTVVLRCGAESDTELGVHWYHNGREIDEPFMDILFEMNSSNIGNYTCKVSNIFGEITRYFNINRKECILNIENDLGSKQPFFITLSKQWFPFKHADGLITIPKGRTLLLSCLMSRMTDKKKYFSGAVPVTCVEKSTFKLRRKLVDYKDLSCLTENKPVAKNTGDSCGQITENTKLVTVGFNSRTNFLSVYDVCLDVINKVPVFAKHIMNPSFANVVPKDFTNANYSESNHLPFEFDYMYDCKKQMPTFISLRMAAIDSCCYKKRQLISPRDVLPGQSQLATYNYLNVVPHWSTCGTENWNEVEQRVRNLVHSLDESLEIWTGSSKTLSSYDEYKYLPDKYDKQPISPYLWKVIYNPIRNEAVAIIQINVAGLTLSNAIRKVPCRDICRTIDWMVNPEWYNVNKGFTVCCNVEEFQSVFGFNFTNAKRVLSQSVIPKYALTIR